ncbi:hypothetical protein A5672_25205 [Mycobacterium alsense]|uniref:Facilitated glucose transporter n=1 Tax=Mycobacterium alsense TaxID=324058 RepID=A0ABD6NZH7_9MYCO|nr:hypothetical protein [Mycobacterium alsense]OBG32921.1 hypothetical protein A5672_25205 [Mycobacterium alsense]OBJ05626.1 hypothetical protein A5660_15690 [Mycobacterium alsense]
MGHRLDSLQHRQRPDLIEAKPRAAPVQDSGATDPAIRFVVLALLAVDGILSALTGALLLPLYIGAIPFPISGLISGLLNAALVWAAGLWVRSARVAALPLWTWLLTVAVMSLGGPGGDVILGGRGLMAYGALVLIVLGVTPPVWVLWRQSRR